MGAFLEGVGDGRVFVGCGKSADSPNEMKIYSLYCYFFGGGGLVDGKVVCPQYELRMTNCHCRLRDIQLDIK